MGTKNSQPFRRERLTAVVLCKDAGETLRKCLLSLSFCDKVILADDGSSDASTEIARHYGVKILRLNPTDSFAEKRNQTLASIKEGWILFVDADEQVSPTLEAGIEKVLVDPQSDGYFILRRDTFLNRKMRHGEAGAMWLLRLARVKAGKWNRRVHEVWAVTGEVGRIHQGELIHSPHPSLESFLDSINRYTQLEIEERVKSGVNTFIVWLQLFTFPIAKFFQNYIWRLGFLDGIQGFIHAYMMSLHSLLVRIKILEYVRARKTI